MDMISFLIAVIFISLLILLCELIDWLKFKYELKKKTKQINDEFRRLELDKVELEKVDKLMNLSDEDLYLLKEIKHDN